MFLSVESLKVIVDISEGKQLQFFPRQANFTSNNKDKDVSLTDEMQI